MNTIDLQTCWHRLTSTSAQASNLADELRLAQVHSKNVFRLFCCVRAEPLRRGVLLDLPVGTLAPKHLLLETQRFVVRRLDGNSGLTTGREGLLLELLDQAYEDLFSHMCTDVYESLMTVSTGPEAATAVHSVVERWVRFMERRSARLSTSEIKGLIGELNVLERLIATCGAKNALDFWKSPSGSIRDFELDTASIEVKTFTPSDGASIRINDPHQLEPDFDVPLHLVCVELSRCDKQGSTLSGHIARIGGLFADDFSALASFKNMLFESGYADWQSDLYRDCWCIGALHVFTVRHGFPRIKPSTVPEGVETVRFSLEVAKLLRYSGRCEAISAV